MRSIAKSCENLTRAVVFVAAISFAASTLHADNKVHITAGGNVDQTTSPPTLQLIGSVGGLPVSQGCGATSVDTPTPDKEYQILDGPHWVWDLGPKLPADGVAAITPTDQQGTVFTAQTSKAIQKGYTLSVTVYWTEVGMVGTPVAGKKNNIGPPSDSIAIQLTIVDEVLTVSDPTWGATKQDKDNDDGSPPTPLSAGTRTQGSGADDLGGIEFNLADLAGDAIYDWAIYDRFSGAQLADDTTHDQPASGTFSTDDTVGARTFLPPGGYYIRLTKESDSNVKRLITFDVIGVHFQFAAVPTTQPTTQPVVDEKVYGGYTMLDQNASAIVPPTGSSNASLVLEGPPDVQGTWKINFPSSVTFWQVNPGASDTIVSSGHNLTAVTLPCTIPLKMQGRSASSSERDVSLTGTFTESTPTTFTMNDVANATVASLEMLDAQSFSPNIDGGIDTDPTSGSGTPMIGALSDGASVLVVRMKPNVHAPIALDATLHHTNADPACLQTPGFVGSVSPLSAFPALPGPGTSASVSLHSTDAKGFFYCPPNDFWFGKRLMFQPVVISATIAGLAARPASLEVMRPSIILAHGVASSGTTLTRWANIFSGGGRYVRVVILSYPSTNCAGYNVNAALVPSKISGEVSFFRSAGIAATRIDYCGHSMAGCIAKWYVANFGDRTLSRRNGFPSLIWPGASASLAYKRANNFGLGDIHRIVTVGSPLQGSPLADAISGVLGYDGVVWVVANAGLGGDGAAADDLGFTSAATRALTATRPVVAWHPIVGQASPGMSEVDLTGGVVDFLVTPLGQLPSNYNLLATNSDCIVWESSQCDSTIFPPNGTIYRQVTSVVHTGESQNILVIFDSLEALDLLYSSPGDTSYTPGNTLFNGSM